MAKKIVNISQFKTGIHNRQDPRDIPEDAIVDGVNVITDVEGKVRQIGRDENHSIGSLISSSGIKPGFGLFTFKSDYRLNNIDESEAIITSHETDIFVYQNENNVMGFDTESSQMTDLGSWPTSGQEPAYYYSQVDGALRVCDSNFKNFQHIEGVINHDSSNTKTKYIKMFDKTWFPGLSSSISIKGWKDSENYIYPPTIQAYGTPVVLGAGTTENSQQLVYEHITHSGETVGTSDMIGGDITIQTNFVSGTGDSDWLKETLYKFGVSFTYEGGQESPVTYFTETWGDENSTDGYKLQLSVFVHPGTDGEPSFDSRITGCNVYLCGDDSGFYEDPYFLAEFFWGKSSSNPARLTTSDGSFTETFTVANGVVHNTSVINILKTPVITFSMRNGYKTDTASIALNYKTAVIANRRCYAGGIRQWSFNIHTGINKPDITVPHDHIENDTMIVSPVDNYDIFPSENKLIIGSNDGDHIVKLLEYADRILQFKQNVVYIINISEDYEYVEEEFQFYGIDNPYQAIKTDKGIIWVNRRGCFQYNGEEVINLIDGKILKKGGGNGNFDRMNKAQIKGPAFSWDNWDGGPQMIGYIPDNRQIVITSSPSAILAPSSLFDSGREGYRSRNILIYDFDTEAWSRGEDRLKAGSLTNFINDFNNDLVYGVLSNDSSCTFKKTEYIESISGSPEIWSVLDCDNNQTITDAQGSRLLIGTTPITDILHHSSMGLNFRDVLKQAIEDYNIDGLFDIVYSGSSLVISMSQENVLKDAKGDFDTVEGSTNSFYTGRSLAWDTTDSMGAPTAGASFTLENKSGTFKQFYAYEDISDHNWGSNNAGEITPGVYFEDAQNQWAMGVGGSAGLQHIIWFGGNSSETYDPGLIQDISWYVNCWGTNPFYQNANDAPTVSTYSDSPLWEGTTGTTTTLKIDLYAPSVFNNDMGVQIDNVTFSGNVGSRVEWGGKAVYGDVCTSNTIYSDIVDKINEYQPDAKIWCAFYNAAPKVEGSGETGSDASSSNLYKQYEDGGVGQSYYERDNHTFKLNTAIWVRGETESKILIPGKKAEFFTTGLTYTFGNTGRADNNQSYIFSDISEHLYGIDGEDNTDYTTLTVLTYLESDNPTIYDTVDNWSTGLDITVDMVGDGIGFGGHTTGIAPRGKDYAYLPAMNDDIGCNPDSLQEKQWELSLRGQDGLDYYFSSPHSSYMYGVGHWTAGKAILAYKDRVGDAQPWWDVSHVIHVPNWTGIFSKNGIHLTTVGNLTNSDTTPFDVTLGDGLSFNGIYDQFSVGDVLIAKQKSSANFEMMQVSSIITGGIPAITVTRNYLNHSSTGSAINFGVNTVEWYKTTILKQVSSTVFDIIGTNLSHVLESGIGFMIEAPSLLNTAGDNYYTSHQWYITEHSAYNSSTGVTTVTISTDDVNIHDESLGGGEVHQDTLGGSNGSFYIHRKARDGSDAFAPENEGLWVKNIGGDQPGNESINNSYYSDVVFSFTNNTGSTDGYGPNGWWMRIIAPRFKYHPSLNTNTYLPELSQSNVYTGLEMRKFENTIVSAYQNSGSVNSRTYFLTRDIALTEDDMITKHKIYHVDITYRSEGSLEVYAILDGKYTNVLKSEGREMFGGHAPGNDHFSTELSSINRQSRGSDREWRVQRFVFPTNIAGASQFKSASTIRFYIGTANNQDSGFEVNDISVSCRAKDTGRKR